MRLDTAARTATLSTKEVVEFGVALVATGANVRRLRVDGAQLQGIHYLRALGNADAIRADAEQAERVVLVGGSYIACEVAATLTALGRRCTMVMLEDAPLVGALRPDRGRVLRRAAARARRRARLRRRARAARGRRARRARRDRVRARARRRHGRDGHGRDARRDARARGRARAGGDAAASPARAASRRPRAGVWAAGDMCEYDSVLHGGRVRIEHYEVARAQGRGGRGGDARHAPAVRRAAVLLDRPVRLVHGRVGRDHRGARARDRARRRSTTARSACCTSPAAGWSPRCRSGAATTSRTRAPDRRGDRPRPAARTSSPAATSRRSESGRGRRVAAVVVDRLEHEDLDAEPVGGVDLRHERVHAPAGQALDAVRNVPSRLDWNVVRTSRTVSARSTSISVRSATVSTSRSTRDDEVVPDVGLRLRRALAVVLGVDPHDRLRDRRAHARRRSARRRRRRRSDVGPAPRCRASVIGRRECRPMLPMAARGDARAFRRARSARRRAARRRAPRGAVPRRIHSPSARRSISPRAIS